MPNYDFKCNTCATKLETQDPALPSCPFCGEIMTRIWTAPAIHLTGHGFYSTDKGR